MSLGYIRAVRSAEVGAPRPAAGRRGGGRAARRLPLRSIADRLEVGSPFCRNAPADRPNSRDHLQAALWQANVMQPSDITPGDFAPPRRDRVPGTTVNRCHAARQIAIAR